MKYYSIFLISLSLSVLTCKTGKSSLQDEAMDVASAEGQVGPIPAMLANVRDRADFVLKNFWQDVCFNEESLYENSLMDKKFVTFVRLLSRYPDSTLWTENVAAFVSRLSVSQEVYEYFVEQAEFYLYYPNSPVRDEKLYQVFINQFLDSPYCNEIIETRLLFQRTMMAKNRIGSVATDFSYVTADGKRGKLLETAEGKYLILLFYSPGCRECEYVEALLKENEVLQEMIDNGNVALLAVYIDGIKEVWEECKNNLPKTWISAMDCTGIKRNELYDLKAIPSLYFLDENHRVVLKDVDFLTLLSYLKQ